MPITITPETGAGVAGANSYLTVAQFKTYADNHGLSYAGKTDDQIAAALIRATTWIDAHYRNRWPGVRTYGSTQTLLWPRRAGIIVNQEFYLNGVLTTITDSEGLAIAINAIPTALINATAEATYREMVKPGALAPDLARGGAIRGVKAGSVAVDYFSSAPAGTTFSVIDGLLAGILVAAEGGYTARAVRA